MGPTKQGAPRRDLLALARLKQANPSLLLSVFCLNIVQVFTFIGQNQSAFSISQLKALLLLHVIPINRIVYARLNGEHSSWNLFRTYMLSALIKPCVATLRLPLE